MAEVERVYTIPLRRRYMAVSRWRRAEKAVKVVREFIARHMKADDVKIGIELNQFIWQYGGKRAPPRVKVRVIAEEEDGKKIARVNLLGVEEKKKEEKKKDKVEKVEIGGEEKKEEQKETEKKEENAEKESKEETKEEGEKE